MRTTQKLSMGILLCSALLTHAEEQPNGPKGGRLLENAEPRAEFLLDENRTATITFYDASLQPVPAGKHIVTVIADAPDGKKTISFENKGDVLVSTSALPDGEDYTVIVQIKANADAKPQNVRFKLLTHLCEECKFKEYACVCHE